MNERLPIGLASIRETMYSMKRDFGRTVSLLVPKVAEVRIDEGITVRRFDKYIIQRAIRLTAASIRKFETAFTSIAASKGFSPGGMFDMAQFVLIVDGKDLVVAPTLNDHFESDGERHQIRSIAKTDASLAYLFVLETLTNSVPIDESLIVSV